MNETRISTASGNVSDIFVQLADGEIRLSANERKIADLILKDANLVTGASITELAELAGVSPPTVTRFCRHLGFGSYSDFKVQLAKSAFVGMRYINPESVTSNATEVAEDIVTKAQNALFQVHRALDPDQLEKVARLLAGARMIYSFGSGGNSSMIARELCNRLFRLGCLVSWESDHGMYQMIAAAAEPGAVAIGFSITGRNAELVRCFQILSARDIPTIALTQTDSPLSQVAGTVIAIDLTEGKNIYRPSSTRFAYLAVIDMIANLVAYEDRKGSARILRRIKETLIRIRDDDDRQILGD